VRTTLPACTAIQEMLAQNSWTSASDSSKLQQQTQHRVCPQVSTCKIKQQSISTHSSDGAGPGFEIRSFNSACVKSECTSNGRFALV